MRTVLIELSIVVALALLLAGCQGLPLLSPAAPSPPPIDALAIAGTVKAVDPSAGTITLDRAVQGIDTVAVSDQTTIVLRSGEAVALPEIQQGMHVQAAGSPGEQGTILARLVMLDRPSAPVATPSTSPG